MVEVAQSAPLACAACRKFLITTREAFGLIVTARAQGKTALCTCPSCQATHILSGRLIAIASRVLV